MRQTAGHRPLAALPGELHLDAVVAVGGQHLARYADDDGGPVGMGGGPPGPAGLGRHDRHVGRHGGEAVAVGAAFQVGRAEQPGDVRAQVVGRLVLHTQHGVVAVVAVVLRQREARASGQHTGAAGAVHDVRRQLLGLQGQQRGTPGCGRIGIPTLACAVVTLQQGPRAERAVR